MAMNALIGAARIALGYDTAALEKGDKKVRGMLDSLGKTKIGRGAKAGLDDLTDGFNSTARQAGVLGSALSAMGPAGVGVAAILVSLGGAAAIARKAMAFGDEIADTANKLAVSTKYLQETRYAVHALGGEYTDADKALEGFSKAFGLAQAKFSARSVKPFKALGVDPAEFGSMELALDAVIEKIADLSSASEQAAIAEKLGIGAMLPAIREGTTQLNFYKAAASRLGFVMKDDVIQKAGEANDRMEDLEQTLKVQVNSAFVDLAPEILKVTEAMVDGAKALHDYADAVHDTFTEQKQQTAEFLAWLSRQTITSAFTDVEIPMAGPLGSGLKLFMNEAAARAGTAPQLDAGVDGPSSAQIAAAMANGLNGDLNRGPPARLDATGGGSSGSGKSNTEASARAVEAAMRAEADAQMQLTRNIERLADMRLAEIDAETKAENRRLRADAAQGDITKAAADEAIALNNKAALAKKMLVTRQREDDLALAALDQQEVLGRYAEQAARIQASLGVTAEARGKLEADSLAAAQKREAAQLKAQLARDVRDKAISQADADAQVAAQANAHALERTAQAQEAVYDQVQEQYDKARAGIDMQIEALQAQGDLAQSEHARAVINLRILALEQREARLAAQAMVDTTKIGTIEHDIAVAKLAQLDALQAMQTEAAESAARLDRAIVSAADDVVGIFRSLKSNDLEGAFGSLEGAIYQFAGLLGKTGSSLLGKLGGAVGTIGAAAGIGQSLGLGTKSTAANLGLAGAGYLAGTAFLTAPLAGVGGGIAASLGGSVFGGAMTSMLGAAAGPIGVLAALAVGTLLTGLGKESNHAAIATLNGDSYSLSGNKRNAQTESLATATADTIIQVQNALEAAGIKLNDAVHAIDIGTRDAAHIILESGRVLEAGVGDAAGAAELALTTLLDGATYASDAQEALVRSMLEAGDGFDKIAEKLELFGEQLKLPQAIEDAIQQIVDPKAYEISQLKRGQSERRSQIDAAVAGGAVGADAAAGLYAQLSKLEGLELDQVLARFADKVEDATDDTAAALDRLNDAVTEAEGDLRDAYNAEAAVHKATVQRLGNLADGLRQTDEALRQEGLAARGGVDQTAVSRAAIAALDARVRSNPGDEAALAALQDAAVSFAASAKESAPTQEALQGDLAWVRRIVANAADIAQGQADTAQTQLDVLNEQVGALIKLDSSVLSVRDAIANLAAAQAAVKGIGASLGGAANDNGGGPPAGSIWDSKTESWLPSTVTKSDLDRMAALGIGISGPAGDSRQMLLDSYRYGQFDHLVDAQGNPTGVAAQLKLAGFKDGGQFEIGGMGGLDSQLVSFMGTPGEMVSVTHGDPMGGVVRALDNRFASMEAHMRAGARYSYLNYKIARRQDVDGTPPERTAL